MKYKRKLAILLLIAAIFTGCGGRKDPTPAPVPSSSPAATGSIAEYFPMKPNILYEYNGIGSDAMSQRIFNVYINGSIVQRYIMSSTVRNTDTLALSDGALSLIYLDPYSLNLDDVTGIQPQLNNLILKEPLELGAKWDDAEIGSQSEITNMAATVETPFGSYEAIEVSTQINANGTIYDQRDYYAKGVGLVKSVSENQGGPTIGYELASLTENARFSWPYYYFSPAEADQENYTLMEERDLELPTNGDMTKIMEEQFRIVTEEGERPVISAGTKVNSIKPDRDNDRLTIDFSKEFVTEMADGKLARNILQSVVNTLGNLYRVSEVRVLVEGKGFDNGTLTLGQEEYVEVERPEARQTPTDAETLEAQL